MAYRYALVNKPDKKDFNSAPFIHNKTAVQQGCVTSEPYEVEKQGGFRPNIFLLSDYGYSTYSTLIETSGDDRCLSFTLQEHSPLRVGSPTFA